MENNVKDEPKIKNRNYVLKKLKENGTNIKFFNGFVQNDMECVLTAMKYSEKRTEANKSNWIEAYDYLPENMKNNEQVIDAFWTLYTEAPKYEMTKEEEREWSKYIRQQDRDNNGEYYLNDENNFTRER